MNVVECLGFPHSHRQKKVLLHGSGPVPLEPLALAAQVALALAQAASPRLRRQPKRPGAGDSAVAKIVPSYTLW
jgi:hypothetical protein